MKNTLKIIIALGIIATFAFSASAQSDVLTRHALRATNTAAFTTNFPSTFPAAFTLTSTAASQMGAYVATYATTNENGAGTNMVGNVVLGFRWGIRSGAREWVPLVSGLTNPVITYITNTIGQTNLFMVAVPSQAKEAKLVTAILPAQGTGTNGLVRVSLTLHQHR